jgi:hypothetical protein
MGKVRLLAAAAVSAAVSFGAASQVPSLEEERYQMMMRDYARQRQADMDALAGQIERQNICKDAAVQQQMMETFNAQAELTKSHGRLIGIANPTTPHPMVAANLLTCLGTFSFADGSKDVMRFTMSYVLAVH